MFAIAKGRYIRVSPRKVREVIDLIRGKDVPTSQAILEHVNRRSSTYIKKVLNSAVANAKSKGVTEDQLYVSKVVADQGPTWKRWNAVAFGRAAPILKKTTHLTVELDLITK